jgi:transcriptional regulator with XRE-family HTH domain
MRRSTLDKVCKEELAFQDHLIKKCRDRRLKLGLNIQAFARHIGIRGDTYYNFEKKINITSFRNLVAIARKMGLTLHDFFHSEQDTYYSSPENKAIILMFEAMDVETKDHVLNFARHMIVNRKKFANKEINGNGHVHDNR